MEAKDLSAENYSGLYVAISLKGGLMAFIPGDEETSNQMLILNHKDFAKEYSMILVNTNRTVPPALCIRS